MPVGMICFLLCTIVLPLICALTMRVICNGVRACYSFPEENDEFERRKKAASNFKKAASIMLGLPSILVLVMTLVFWIGGSSRGNSLYGLVLFFGSVGLLISFFASFYGYGYLFLAKDDHTAGLILALPFFPIVFSVVLGFVVGGPSVGEGVLSALSAYIVGWIVMRILLAHKRKNW
ncbi:hypothetical protein [Fibrobacter succinogenes]|uniref:hypothetical protein n=1 Tax=Fibrobacter succinogenes TaxID=833 RepID=UPI001567C287|nr:hypothetical protein [Fibrobacter succinogenes]